MKEPIITVNDNGNGTGGISYAADMLTGVQRAASDGARGITQQVAIGKGEGEQFQMGGTLFTPADNLPSVQQAKLDTLSKILINQAPTANTPVQHAEDIHRAFTALDFGNLVSKDNAKELAGAVADVAETYHKTGDLRAAILGAVLHFFGHK